MMSIAEFSNTCLQILNDRALAGYELLSNLQLVTIQKEEIPRISSFCIISEKLFLSVFHVVLVTVHELVNTSCSVDQFNLTGIERV